MRLVVITQPGFGAGEAETIRELLDGGIDRVHLRKPFAPEAAMRRLLDRLDPAVLPRITLQDCLGLAAEYGAGGVHLNARHPEPPQGFRGLVSRSCHSLEELEELEEHAADDYLFLSPIFDSISKVGYTARFTAESLLEAAARGIVNDRVLALGGVRPEYLPRIRAYGFGGAALMGCIWQAADAGTLSATLGAIRKYRNKE